MVGEGLREVTRRAVTAEIAANAMDLFTEQGFEGTTVDQIAAAVGVSTRTVFRYFAGKEDMVVGNLMELGHELAAALEARPADEAPWAALRAALQVCVESLEAAGLPRATILAETPALRTALLRKHLQWQEVLAPVLAKRLGGDEFAAHALGSAALSCLDVAGYEWTRVAGKQPLGDLLDAAIEAVSPPAR
ncbi:TetR family transcriptional regulator [Amycolatopsis sp. NPDC051372]|uniref:TetR/AcrR family transcriptional regulator n=1 Tax=unclassified Amycolatopsis TaxID=2618356 RepID=UPI00341A362C